uniref:Uncharacterized protein AlNc14C24G2434 n=1 Tax=Albugo laibachii Nc14 TaxID=890382 RepID=F0W6D4_9STRA|nr:conserved hypothetical protein [Albugo laibachii Nc14]|eukprot:CCA16678.1 conserved hypothetical protein [Albugo laibachii Nc14]
MSDPFYLADILLGRVGVLRSTTESLLLELCKPQSSLDHSPPSKEFGLPGSTESAPTATNPDGETVRALIKNKLERIQTNLKLLKRLGPEFVALEKKVKGTDEVIPAHRRNDSNLSLEYHWKHHVQEMGEKAHNVFIEFLCKAFPRLEMLGDERCPPPPNLYFIPKSHKRLRLFDFGGRKMPTTLSEMMDFMMSKNPKLVFYKQVETTRGGRRVIRSIRCDINNEIAVWITFCPLIPEEGPNGEIGVNASPMTPSTPTSPATLGGRNVRHKAKQRQQKQLILKKWKNDMLARARLAAEEATKIEVEELKVRMAQAREESRELQLFNAASLQVTSYIQRLSVFPLHEEVDLCMGAWAESRHQLFQLITLHARKAMRHFKAYHPKTCFYHLFTWFGYYEKLYQTPCTICKRILIKENEEWAFMPPSFRDYGSGVAYHAKCLAHAHA